MKLLNLEFLFTLCITLISALNLNDIPIPAMGLQLVDPGYFTSNVEVSNCSYNQGRRRIYCNFKDSKYTKKKLYIMVPVLDGSSNFSSNDVIKEWSLNHCLNSVCSSTPNLAVMTGWERIEGGDTYRPSEVLGYTNSAKFTAILSNNNHIDLYYKKVYVNQLN